MIAENRIKISYKGLTRQILCGTKFLYDDLLKTVIDTLNIENSCKLAIEFYDEKGHKYNKDTLEYFLLLFPNPQKIFFIRLDASKISNLSNTETTPAILLDERLPFGDSKLSKFSAVESEPTRYFYAAPVRRQNCFLGQLPDSTSSSQSSNQLNCGEPLAVIKSNRNVLKRSMRI